jgi:hypothetical protein
MFHFHVAHPFSSKDYPYRTGTLGKRRCLMPQSLPELEQQRTALLQQISELGDFRAGSITGTGGKCGNRNCHCHGPKLRELGVLNVRGLGICKRPSRKMRHRDLDAQKRQKTMLQEGA